MVHGMPPRGEARRRAMSRSPTRPYLAEAGYRVDARFFVPADIAISAGFMANFSGNVLYDRRNPLGFAEGVE